MGTRYDFILPEEPDLNDEEFQRHLVCSWEPGQRIRTVHEFGCPRYLIDCPCEPCHCAATLQRFV